MGTDRSALGVFRRVQILKVAAFLLSVLLATPALAQPLSASAGEAQPPAELAPPIRSQLATDAFTVKSGTTTLEFWWVKSIERSGGDGWTGVPEGALVGAVRLSGTYPDIRGRRIKPGVYTLRFALQPMNGDHLGVSPHREFMLIAPAAADTNPAPAGYQGTVDLSKQTTGASHPAAWSLDPPTNAGELLRVIANDEGHHGVVFRVHDITFGLILIGKIEA